MLNIVYGKSGSGKTTYINNCLSSLIKNSDKQAVLIVPEQFSFSSERKMLELLGPVDCNRVEIVMSFTHVSESVFKIYGTNKLPSLDESSKSILMSLAYDSVTDNLEAFSNSSQYPSFIKDMVNVSTQIKRGNISSSMINEALDSIEDELLKKKLHDVDLIMTAYDALLDGRFYDPDDKLTALSKVLEEFDFFAGKTVFIDGFTGFTGQEYKIIEKILLQAENVYITACTDEPFGDENEYSVFLPVRKTLKKIIDIARKNNVPISAPIKTQSNGYKSEEIEILEDELFSKQPWEHRKCDNIKIVYAKNMLSECDYIASQIKKHLKQGYRCREIAVVSRDNDKYESYLKTALERCGVEVFSDRRFNISMQPLCVFIKYALDIAHSGINNENIFSYLKTGLTGISIEDIAEIENYVLMWNIRPAGWKKDFFESPFGFSSDITNQGEEKLKKLNATRKRIIKPLGKFITKLRAGVNAIELSENIYKLLTEVNAGENLKEIAKELEEKVSAQAALLQQRVWDCVMSVLNDISNIIGTNKKTISQFETIFSIALNACELGNIPQGLDEVTVGDVLRTRMDEPKIVFVAGVNEDVFPKLPNDSSTFSGREIKLLNEAGIEISNTIEEEYFEERLLGYRTFTSPKDKLYVTYSTNDLTSAETPASEFVDEIVQIFPTVEKIDVSALNSEFFIESEQTAFSVMAQKWNDDDTLSSSLKEVFGKRDNCRSKIESLDRISGEKNIKIESKEIALKLFGKNMYQSPSRVEQYHKCPFAYFCRYAIGANKPERTVIDPRARGNVIHYCLEKLVKIYGIKALSDMQDDVLRGKVNGVLLSYAQEFMGSIDNKTERFKQLFLTFEKSVFKLIKRIIDEFSECEFEPVDFELSVDRDGEIKPYEIPIDTGGVISLRGKIDRVDSYRANGKNYIRVVDYKTGNKNFVLSDVFYGLNMQMLAYLFSIWENGEEKYGQVVPAGVLYMPSGTKTITAKRNASNEEINEQYVKEGRMNGVVLSNTQVIEAMGSKYSPAKIDKKTLLPAGDVLNLVQMSKLKEKIDDILYQMAKHLGEGNINAVPVEGEDYKDVCGYCDYKDICVIEDDDERRKIEKKSFKEICKILSNEEENVNG